MGGIGRGTLIMNLSTTDGNKRREWGYGAAVEEAIIAANAAQLNQRGKPLRIRRHGSKWRGGRP